MSGITFLHDSVTHLHTCKIWYTSVSFEGKPSNFATPSYCSDLAPCDFVVFPCTKKSVPGRVIGRSWVPIPAGAAGEFSSPGSAFCADSFRYPFHPLLPQQHVKDPDHSAKSAGGRLQLKYACTLRMRLRM